MGIHTLLLNKCLLETATKAAMGKTSVRQRLNLFILECMYSIWSRIEHRFNLILISPYFNKYIIEYSCIYWLIYVFVFLRVISEGRTRKPTVEINLPYRARIQNSKSRANIFNSFHTESSFLNSKLLKYLSNRKSCECLLLV